MPCRRRAAAVEIARSLCINPTFILLDEPFSGIDPIAVLDLQKIISDLRASGIGVLITDHNVRETLSVTDRAYIINEGRIFRSGTPEELGSDPEVRRVYLGRASHWCEERVLSYQSSVNPALPGTENWQLTTASSYQGVGTLTFGVHTNHLGA